MARFNEARKITKAQQQMYVAVNAMRTDLKETALKHFKKTFDDEGFTEKVFWHWTPLKTRRPERFRGQKILTNTGKLKRSIKTRASSNKRGFSVTFFSNVRYAAIHNEGLKGLAYGKYPFKMPKRMFMGYSTVLDRKLKAIFANKINKVFK